MQATKNTSGAILTPQQVEAMLQSEEAFATYLCTLTPEQVRDLRASLKNSPMEPSVGKALIALLDLAEHEAVRNEEELKEKLMPMARNLSICFALFEEIKQLETLHASL